MMKRISSIVILLSLISVSTALAHFPILIHDAPFAEINKPVNLLYAVGHPYEQEYEDAEKPQSVFAIKPSGQKVQLIPILKGTVHTVRDQKAKAFKLAYTPDQKGDHIIGLNSSIYFGRKQQAYQDFLKVFIHAERTEGWRNKTGQPMEIVPLTRPYGLEAGFVFSGQVLKNGEPAPGVEIEIEQYLDTPPDLKNLPPEPMITRIAVTDPNGVFVHTLPHQGWWIMAAYVEDVNKIRHEGKTYSLNAQAAMWVHVE